MKKFITIFILMLICMPMMARQISETEALQKAKGFSTKELTGVQSLKNDKVDNALKLSYSCKEAGENLYYVFNRGENQGFVIISGDDRAYEVLGYSNTGNFDYNNIPTNMKGWLNSYAAELKVLINNPEMTTIKPKFNTKGYATSVDPLLGAIAWNQDKPYNDLCPVLTKNGGKKYTAASGCVATAMAQTMYYHQWPVKGEGSHSYKWNGNTYSADFSKTTYEWAKMTPTYNSSSTPESNNAVAVLMSHCGISVDMEYGESSGAQSVNIPKALNTYFGYDKGMRYLGRDFFSIYEWVDLIKNELSSKRVVIYGGSTGNKEGHQFVFDGYDKNDMFHVNWGWGGTSDGYFKINALTPESQGIGGSTSGFNYLQDMVIGIQKETGISTITYEIQSNVGLKPESAEINRTDETKILLDSLYNTSWDTFSGHFGLGIYRDDKLVEVISQQEINDLQPTYGYNLFTFNNVSVSSLVANGDYQIYPIFVATGDITWSKIRVLLGSPKYINLTVTSDKLKFSLPTEQTPVLKTVIAPKGKVYSDMRATIACTITNTGGDYHGVASLHIKDNATDLTLIDFPEQVIDLGKGESTIVDFTESVSLIAGEYFAYVKFDKKTVSNTTPITVLPKPTEEPKLTIANKISFPDNNNVPKENMRLSAKITNTGGYFDGEISAYIFNQTDTESVGQFPKQSIMVDKNETIDVALTHQSNLKNGAYTVAIYALIDKEWELILPKENSFIPFTLVSSSGVESVTAKSTIIYPNPAINFIGVESEGIIKAIRIYDMTGRMVLAMTGTDTQKMDIDISSIASGNYIVQVVGENGIGIKQLIIK